MVSENSSIVTTESSGELGSDELAVAAEEVGEGFGSSA